MVRENRNILIFSGSPSEVEDAINDLLDRYVPIVWNIQPGKDGPLVSCILAHKSLVQPQRVGVPIMASGRIQ
jgi:hypothetical protein